jgi:hypothetical protein
VTSILARLLAAGAVTFLVLLFARDVLDGLWWWVGPSVAAIAVALAFAIPIDQRLLPPGWTPGLILGVIAINYACVPETDHFVEIAVLPALLIGAELWSNRRLPWGVLVATAAFVLWGGVYGATGRESALVGALFSWWPVVTLPCFARWLPTVRTPRLVSLALVIVPLASAPAVVSRSGALEPTVGRALSEVAVAAPVSLAVAAIAALGLQQRGVGGRDGQRAG